MLSVSSDFAKSMPVVGPVAGFGNAKSDWGKKLFTDAVFQNAAIEADLAGRAIDSKAELKALKKGLKSQQALQQAGRPSRADGLRMAGASLVNLFGGGGGFSAPTSLDPFATLAQLRAIRDTQKQRLNRDWAPSARSIEDTIRLLG